MKNKTFLVVSNNIHLNSEYIKWIKNIKDSFRKSQIKAAVKVNSEQLFFNWNLGRELNIKKIEQKWGKGIVEQVSLDLQSEFPTVKGFSVRNLWNMKKWYSFYAYSKETKALLKQIENKIDTKSVKLQQVGAEINHKNMLKLHQVGAEMNFPEIFCYVPWRHHIEIITKCKSVKEALFYILKTIEENLSRKALIDCINADVFHNNSAITNFSEKLPSIQGKLAQEIIKDKNQTEVQWAFQSIQNPMGIASYDKIKLKDIQKQLPTAKQIQKHIDLIQKEINLNKIEGN